MGTAEYQVIAPGSRLGWLPLVVMVVVFAGLFAAGGDLLSAAFFVALSGALFVPGFVRAQRVPRRVVLDDAGVTFDAPRRRQTVAWAELDEVASYRGPRGALRLAWRLRDGREVRTRLPAGHVQTLLDEIGQRAAHVRIAV